MTCSRAILLGDQRFLCRWANQATQIFVISEKTVFRDTLTSEVELNLRNISAALSNLFFSDILTIIRSCFGDVLRDLQVGSWAFVHRDDLKRATILSTKLLDRPTVVYITEFDFPSCGRHTILWGFFFYHRTPVVSQKPPCWQFDVPIP